MITRRRSLLALPLSLLLPVAAAAAAHQPQALNALLDKVSQEAARGGKPVVLFDIDDTLTNTAGRHRAIIDRFTSQDAVRAEFPLEAAKLRSALAWPDMPYDIQDTARKAGVTDARFIALYASFWKTQFFSNELIPLDPANPGAADYVRAVIRAGGVAAYFTGRAAELRPGTIQGLRVNGFPVPGEDPGAQLFLKADPAQPDAEFKGLQIRKWKNQGVPIAGGFDNEPANINAFRREGPAASFMIFLDTKHSNAPVEVEAGIPWVADFIRPATPRKIPLLERLGETADGARLSAAFE